MRNPVNFQFIKIFPRDPDYMVFETFFWNFRYWNTFFTASD